MSIELFSLESIQEIARQYGYWAVFVGIALENTGVPLPGETITVVAGFLAGRGELNYWIILASAICGAVAGDNFGYWIGKVGGWPFLLKVGKFFRIEDKKLEKVKDQFANNAAKAVFFGRFITLLRIFAGPMAGIANMPYPQFFFCNFGGAALWATTTLTASYFLGKLVPLEEVIYQMGKFGIVAFILIAAIFAVPLWWQYRQNKLAAKD
jgi:membrane protein DedA with SNARE-associated domain